MITSVVLPAFNEATAIADVVKDVQQNGFARVIVIDDGSTDGTGSIARGLGAFVVTHRLNRGKGAAVKTGIDAARLQGADIVVTMDADGQHQAKDISALVTPLTRGECDIVLGTRVWNSATIPNFKVWQNKVGNAATWLLYRQWVNDSQSGFRAYSRRALNCIDVQADFYDFDSEIVREIRANHLSFKEVPISVRYTAYARTKSTRQSLGTGLKTVARMVWQKVA